MNSKNHDLTEFEELITELEKPEVRPYAPHLPHEAKAEMRRNLLAGQQNGLSRHAAMNLWKFAGTAVAAILLMFIVATFISAISNPSTQAGPQGNVVSPPQRTPSAPTPEMMNSQAETQYIGTVEPVRSVRNNIIFDDLVQLADYELLSVEDGTLLRLHWLPMDILDARFHVFIHFIDENGNLGLQVDELPAAEMPLFSREENEVIASDILLPTNDLPNGRYDILFGLYNTETGQRMAVTTEDDALLVDGGTAVQIGSWSPAELQDRIWLISVAPAPGTKLYDTDGVPTTFTFEIGYELVSAESAYLDSSLQPFGEGEIPHYVSYSATADEDPRHKINQGVGSAIVEMTMTSTRVDGLAEAVTAQIWLALPDKRITLPPETLEELVWPLTAEESGEVWLVSVTQKERPSATAPIELEITLGYEFVSDEDVFVKLSYADPDWENAAAGGRLPIDGLENPVFLDSNQGEVTINATLSPSEALQIVGTENPVLVVEMGYIEEVEFEGESDKMLRFLAHETFADYPLDLTTTEEIQYSP